MISVITPTFETGAATLNRTWASLKAQTYSDWEWVVWDDSYGEDVWRQLAGFSSDERFAIRAFRALMHSGVIGQVKRQAFMVAHGDILVELDHDDELTPDALETIATAFEDPEIGFVYSDWCEINELAQSCRYPEGWAFGYGSDYWDEEHGVWVMRAPEINNVTMRHIVSVPNHVRAWRASVYRLLGGHDPGLPVADDYELIVRTFLTTAMSHIPRLLYRQHINTTTTQRTRNAQIQDLVARIADTYAEAIDERAHELGITVSATRST